ncbi:MAG: hypothetical protein HZA66_23895 [Rhodopseudomonas palustris]|uniref:Uncharacterized protein n=1 Tax=Rhodopseudomonas palustris TaxID=1076 RepID=A0A933S3N5_RHOPL|nr:hypothetical protein [Rhodopseudomonas palustris]
MPLLLALFAIEVIVFYQQVAHNIAPFYPPNFDQLSYFLATYDLIGDLHTRGLRAFWGELFQPSSATGTTFVLQGALMSFVGGTNRTALLSLNLFYLLALQFTFFHTVRARTGDSRFAWLGTALLLALATLFLRLGGVYDYRIDFSALCLYGIWVCLVVWSETFVLTARSLIVAAIGILLIYSRFFTIIYVAAVYGGLLLAALVALWLNRSAADRAAAGARIRNILISGSIVAAVCLPRLYLSREAIYNYYVVGHVIGEEKFIRAHELGIYTFADHLLYYPRSILFTHVGPFALWMSAAVLVIALIGAVLIDRVGPITLMRRARDYGFDFLALGFATLIPIAILTANVAKSPVVGGIVAAPIALALALFIAAVWPRTEIVIPVPAFLRRRISMQRSGWHLPVASFVALVLLVIGVENFVSKSLASKPPASQIDLERITELGKTIATFAKDYDLKVPTLSSDRIVDYHNQGTVRLFSIELLHRNLSINPRFGHGEYGIFATPKEKALELFADSDIIVLTDPVTERSVPYPMNAKIKEYWDDLAKWTAANRVLIYSTKIFGIPYNVWVRPLAKLSGTSAGWVTSDGIELEANSATLAEYPFVVLEGKADVSVLGGTPQPTAGLVDPGGKPPKPLPATITMTGQTYRIVIDTRGAVQPSFCPSKIKLTFDRFFVPSKLGINADIRELVIPTPDKHDLLRTAPE